MNEPASGPEIRHARRAKRTVTLLLASVLGLPLTMCGGAAPGAPASSPAQTGYPAQPGYPEAAPMAPSTKAGPGGAYPSAPPPPAAGQPASEASADSADVPRRREAARAELSRAQAELDAAASDCASACRALSSMERATQHLCELAGAPEDQSRCSDARQRLISARERIRSACGACP